jgi:hypothetical protein
LIFSAAQGAWVQPKYEEVLKASKVCFNKFPNE